MIAKATLNPQARALEDCETQIRIIVRDGVGKLTKSAIEKQVKAEINKTIKKIKIKDLQNAAIRSLWSFFMRQYSISLTLFGGDMAMLGLLYVVASSSDEGKRAAAYNKAVEKGFNPDSLSPRFEMNVNQYGVPAREYMQDYLNKRVKPVLDRLCKDYAKDPGDVRGRNSLRNRAEMEVRYRKHLDEIDGFKAAGVKLVIASTHADCSERCRPWQGRVYSLDGTRGTAPDGRKFVPLEEATNIPYTTKAGKTYMNGLLGFNCRHFLVEYKDGYEFPKPNAAQERKEYDITKEQRRLEREVRKWETEAIIARGRDKKRYDEAKENAREYVGKYVEFSRKNGRAFYPSRLKII